MRTRLLGAALVLCSGSGLHAHAAARQQLIAFTSDRSGFAQVYLATADGRGVRPLLVSPSQADDMQPSWAPDGRHIVLARGIGYESGSLVSSRLVVVDVRTGAEKTLLDPGPLGGVLIRPQWSPDGRRIAFAHGGAAQTGLSVSILDLPSGRVSPVPSPPGTTATYPTWSPDGRALAVNGGDLNIYRVDLRSGRATALTSGGGFFTPQYSRTGRLVATRSVSGGGKQVVLIDDRHVVHALTGDGGEDKFPAWLPDGRILYSHGTAPCQQPGSCTVTNGYAIWVMDGTGSRAHAVITADQPEREFGESYPAASPARR